MRLLRSERARSAEQGARRTSALLPAPCSLLSALPSGATLTEVLAALLIMAIGIVSVMTLFPIAVLRSIQATQLTNATLLKLKADSQIDMFDLVGERFIPTPREEDVTHAVVDPLGWQDFASQGPVGPPAGPGGVADFYGVATSGGAPYTQRVAMGPGDTDVRKVPHYRIPGVGNNVPDTPPRIRRLGYARSPDNPGAPVFPPIPNDLFFERPAPVGPQNPVVAREAVLRAMTLQDDFTTLFTGNPATTLPTGDGVLFNQSDTDLSHIEHRGGGPQLLVPGSRAVLVDATGKRSQVRTVEAGMVVDPTLNAGMWTIGWADPLPAGTFSSISEVRIEAPALRYSYILTVRKTGVSGGSRSDIDCAVFFNRPSGDPEDELVHVVTPTTPATGRQVIVSFSTYPSDPARKPPLKKGAYLLDADNLLWYRIRDVPRMTPATTMVTIDLDRAAERRINNVIIPQGVIHVFPLKSRIDQDHVNRRIP